MFLLGFTSFLIGLLNCKSALYMIGGIMCFIAIKKSIFLLFSSICFFFAVAYDIVTGYYSTAFLLCILFWILNIFFYEKTR